MIIDIVRHILIQAAPVMPLTGYWMTAAVLFILLLTAGIDLFTAIIPDILIFLGLFAALLTVGFLTSWDQAAQQLRLAVAAGIVIWAVNCVWRCKFKRDALGMGDAKWTMLAVFVFGILPVLFAWGAGAIIAVFFISGARLAGRKITRVHFAPFLFAGLCLGVYGLRFAAL